MFVARVAFVHAERHVDFDGILEHIDSRRASVESACGPTVRRLGWAAVHNPIRPANLQATLSRRLEQQLARTAEFGYREARAELRSLRHDRKAPAPPVTAGHIFPDTGRHGAIAEQGLAAIRALLRQRAQHAAGEIAAAARTAAAQSASVPDAVRVAAATLAATRILHNTVLELVGETLNLGRTAGIATLAAPPQYAMRSEQLDANTCDPCDQLHGTIVEIGAPDYYDLMPPSGCLGGGRCRGIYVYGDEPVQLEQAA